MPNFSKNEFRIFLPNQIFIYEKKQIKKQIPSKHPIKQNE